MDKIIRRDGANKSPWQHGVALISPVEKNKKIYDCLVIGAGITGLTVALILQSNGQQTVIADAHSVGFGTTGGTSAHLNTFADTTYKEAAKAFGEKGAQLFAGAVNEGFAIIKK